MFGVTPRVCGFGSLQACTKLGQIEADWLFWGISLRRKVDDPPRLAWLSQRRSSKSHKRKVLKIYRACVVMIWPLPNSSAGCFGGSCTRSRISDVHSALQSDWFRTLDTPMSSNRCRQHCRDDDPCKPVGLFRLGTANNILQWYEHVALSI